jgi:hypothetical protein
MGVFHPHRPSTDFLWRRLQTCTRSGLFLISHANNRHPSSRRARTTNQHQCRSSERFREHGIRRNYRTPQRSHSTTVHAYPHTWNPASSNSDSVRRRYSRQRNAHNHRHVRNALAYLHSNRGHLSAARLHADSVANFGIHHSRPNRISNQYHCESNKFLYWRRRHRHNRPARRSHRNPVNAHPHSRNCTKHHTIRRTYCSRNQLNGHIHRNLRQPNSCCTARLDRTGCTYSQRTGCDHLSLRHCA